MDNWPCDAEKYTLQRMIGQGAFAKVYRATCPSRTASVAIKVPHHTLYCSRITLLTPFRIIAANRARRTPLSLLPSRTDSPIVSSALTQVIDLEHVTCSFEEIRQEVQMMRMCRHPNVLCCHCSFVRKRELYLVRHARTALPIAEVACL